MGECNPKDDLAVKLIRARIHIEVSQNTNGEAQALHDIVRGMHDTLEFVVVSKKSRQKSGLTARRAIASRIALIIMGLKTYVTLQMKRIETFACCVDALGVDVKSERSNIRTNKEKISGELKTLDNVLANLKDDSISDAQLSEIAQKSIQKYSKFQAYSTDLLDVDKRLREKADRVIYESLDNDDVTKKITKALLRSQSDPGTTDPI